MLPHHLDEKLHGAVFLENL